MRSVRTSVLIPPPSFIALPLRACTSPFPLHPPLPLAVTPIFAMNRNARKPSKANHGARPCSSYNRKRASPEFGSWHHAGLRPGQSPPPRPQPGTPMTMAVSGVTGVAPKKATIGTQQVE
jgi:hypothetical protein